MATSDAQTSSNTIKARCLVQQCTSAKLLTDQNDPTKFVEIQRGAVLFVCFYKGADESDVDKLVKSVLNLRLSESDDNKLVSILDLPGNVLIIPQATLGGRIKGKAVQYHYNIDKERGKELYDKFIDLCESYTKENVKWSENGSCVVRHGTYGIKQVYSTITNGPFIHIVEQ